MGSWIFSVFKVKCPNCKTITTKKMGKVWSYCPKCHTALDILNKVSE